MTTTSRFRTLRLLGLGLAGLLALAATVPARAGEGQVVHVGESTSLQLDGKGWSLDRSASRQVHLVSVGGAGSSASSQTFRVQGLKPGQVTLVFRNGGKTFRASLDVLH
jgi:hypothetical protein